MGHLRSPRSLPLVLLLVSALGCVKAPQRVPAEGSWPLDRIAILTPLEEPPLEFQQPVVGAIRGLGLGFGRGVGVTLVVALSGVMAGGYGVIATTVVAGFFGAVYIPASTVVGVASAETSERVATGEAGILTAMAGFPVNRRLGEQLQKAFRELAGREVPLVEGSLDTSGPLPVSADWLLEARVLGIWNGTTIGMVSVDRPCELYVAAGLRLIRVSDGRAIAGRVAVYKSPVSRPYLEWGAEKGRRLKESVVEACSFLSGSFLEELYLATKHLRSPS